jgi:hypothetical protein
VAPQGGLRSSTLASREAEIERREAELRYRETKLQERESMLSDLKPPNWPPCRPLVYHDIQNDIPESGRWLVKRVYSAFLREYCFKYSSKFKARLLVGCEYQS